MVDFKDAFVRAIKTAVEVFIVALPAGFIFTDAAAAVVVAKSAGLSAGAAAVTVLLNAALTWAQEK